MNIKILSQHLLVPFLALSASAFSAPEIKNNPTDVVLRADFPSGAGPNNTATGIIQFYSLNGTAKVHVDLTGLPKNSGMFSYHIHSKPIGFDKKCESTGEHFNPYNASILECDSQPDDSYCEVGDLSGKNGIINTTCFELFYFDKYLSLDPVSTSYIGNKAINIHLLDTGETLACATILPSTEPEDLLLLDPETEAEVVREYEELAGEIRRDRESRYIRGPSILGKATPESQGTIYSFKEADIEDNEEKESKEQSSKEEFGTSSDKSNLRVLGKVFKNDTPSLRSKSLVTGDQNWALESARKLSGLEYSKEEKTNHAEEGPTKEEDEYIEVLRKERKDDDHDYHRDDEDDEDDASRDYNDYDNYDDYNDYEEKDLNVPNNTTEDLEGFKKNFTQNYSLNSTFSRNNTNITSTIEESKASTLTVSILCAVLVAFCLSGI
ncbi:hypothetical protein WICMUC_002947 [Wickerhamomyces mucosus]|uniref:Superoxide dismutase copper/zinc binding domain-containing protein n=1 Tax=Wickerhamomyces mucosus TaxID=1378264 RepID=A0A9P8PMQ8_9ASCO|nr:hypothetical protein WICMUC_002947 [Wickerhamomyces mucosus]